MGSILRLPHRVCESTCYINGLEDILEWKGTKYPDYLLSVVGGMGEFTYLKIKAAAPPNMVYWGANPKYLLTDLERVVGFKQVVVEGKVFKNTFPKLKEFIDNGMPVVAGALDMYYLHYYKDIYMKQHIPIHYVLVVGYDDAKSEVYVQDCTFGRVQSVSYTEFEQALNVCVPGMSRKNTIRTFLIEDNLASELEIAKRGFGFRAEKMLNPPVSLFGIPAMRKLSKEIFNWEDDESFDHLIIYATIPPHLSDKFENSSGMRVWKSRILKELGSKYNIDSWTKASELFEKSGELIKDICKAASVRDKSTISNLILEVAAIEEQAYKMLLNYV
ncbi:MAG: DUF4872 domain-containing protein [Actinobacteria bacterium]|nr:DUF4872 domain-containing protein [Actinomycetota bacterium]